MNVRLQAMARIVKLIVIVGSIFGTMTMYQNCSRSHDAKAIKTQAAQIERK